MSSKRGGDLGALVYWPDRRKRPIAAVTTSDSTWLTMCGITELWPSVVEELFPYQGAELGTVFAAWRGAGWSERPLTELLWPNGGSHMDLVRRLRIPAEPPTGVPSASASRPSGLRFLSGERPIRMRAENILRLGSLMPEAIQVDRPAEDMVQVSINYQAIGECMCSRMRELPIWALSYRMVWPGYFESLFAAEVPSDTTLMVAA